jgi:hypothetical protein
MNKSDLIAGYRDEAMAKEDCQSRNQDNTDTEDYFYTVKPTME